MTLMSSLRHVAKKAMPAPAMAFYKRIQRRREAKEFEGLSRQQIFTRIYDEGMWGSGQGDDHFDSGSGSHDERIVKPYVAAIQAYLQELGRPNVVDLGCGDFSVGSQIRPFCGTYIACDIVPSLIERNRRVYADMDVDFRVVDLVKDPLPTGDVVFIRQVLQHFSNDDIAGALAKVRGSFKHFVLTEHNPPGEFPPNVDKATGPGIRLFYAPQSGLDITKPPFNVVPVASRILCEVEEQNLRFPSVLVTTAYEL